LFGCVTEVPANNDTIQDNDTVITENINSFEECVAAGYPIMESYPRQCRTAEGKHFISLTDLFDSNKNILCEIDEDCKLVNEELAFSCCWAGESGASRSPR